MNTSIGYGVRWWPGAVIAGLAVLVQILLQLPLVPGHMKGTVVTLNVVLTGALLLVWFFFLARLARRTRFRALFVLIGGTALFFLLFRVHGFKGDLVPNLEWRGSGGDHISRIPTEATATGSDYPQFLGPDRTATLPDASLEADWATHQPRLLWRRPVGEAWSAFAVSGRSAVTQEQDGEEETVACYDLFTGEEIWRHRDRARYDSAVGGVGPRATPTISGDRVYTFGATGLLNCLEMKTGRRIWFRDAVGETGATINPWGMSGSPLVLNDMVVVSPGGTSGKSLTAYRADTGEPVWSAGSSPAGYSSPQVATLSGIEQILIFNRGEVAAHHSETGRTLWQFAWPRGGGLQHVAQPVVLPGDRVFASTGYDIGGKLYQISKDAKGAFRASLLWESRSLKSKFANIVRLDGYLYGLDSGILVCVDIETGRRVWKRGRYGHGQLALVGEHLLLQTEGGDLVLVDVRPGAFSERARLPVLTGKTWNHPALALPYVVVRNDREAACYELPLRSLAVSSGR